MGWFGAGDTSSGGQGNWGTAIGASVPLIGGIISGISQGVMNKKSREWNEKMYNIQRQNALADWNMQNAYNAPDAQMERLKKAGLNPNMVYGTGATAQSTAMPRNADVKQWSPKAPEFETGPVMSSYYDVKLKQQALSNNDAYLKSVAAKTAETYARIANIVSGTARSQFDLDMANTLKNNTIALSNSAVEQASANVRFTLDQNQRAAAMNSVSISEALTRIAKMEAEKANTQLEKEAIYQRIELLKKDNTLRNLDIENYNVAKKPWYMGMVESLFNKYFADVTNRPQGAPLSGYEKQDSIFLKKMGKGLGKAAEMFGSWH